MEQPLILGNVTLHPVEEPVIARGQRIARATKLSYVEGFLLERHSSRGIERIGYLSIDRRRDGSVHYWWHPGDPPTAIVEASTRSLTSMIDKVFTKVASRATDEQIAKLVRYGDRLRSDNQIGPGPMLDHRQYHRQEP